MIIISEVAIPFQPVSWRSDTSMPKLTISIRSVLYNRKNLNIATNTTDLNSLLALIQPRENIKTVNNAIPKVASMVFSIMPGYCASENCDTHPNARPSNSAYTGESHRVSFGWKKMRSPVQKARIRIPMAKTVRICSHKAVQAERIVNAIKKIPLRIVPVSVAIFLPLGSTEEDAIF